MIVKSGTIASVEKHKNKLKLVGDVYIIGNFMETLESHKRLFPQSTAKTIAEAEQERIAYEAEQEELARIASEEAKDEPVDDVAAE